MTAWMCLIYLTLVLLCICIARLVVLVLLNDNWWCCLSLSLLNGDFHALNCMICVASRTGGPLESNISCSRKAWPHTNWQELRSWTHTSRILQTYWIWIILMDTVSSHPVAHNIYQISINVYHYVNLSNTYQYHSISWIQQFSRSAAPKPRRHTLLGFTAATPATRAAAMVRTWQSGMLVGSPSPREQWPWTELHWKTFIKEQQEPQKCYFQIPCTTGSLTEQFASLESWEFQQVTQRIPKAVVSWTKNFWGGKVPLQPRPSPQLRHQPGGASKALKRALQMLKHQDTTCMFMPIQDFLTHQQGTM